MADDGDMLFPSLPKLTLGLDKLQILSTEMDEVDASDAGDNADIDAGWTYFGQFLSHDIGTGSGRTAVLDLDCIYGGGPSDQASGELYVSTDESSIQYGVFKAEKKLNSFWFDFPRRSGVAITTDPRNDETVMLSQMTLGFMLFHNKIIEGLETTRPTYSPKQKFIEANKMVRYHFQWIVINEFLPKIMGGTVWQDFWKTGSPTFAHYDVSKGPHVPREFRLAAYRFGHSMVRPGYILNEGDYFTDSGPLPIASGDLNETTLRGGRTLPDDWVFQWNIFLPVGGSVPQRSRKIDTKLVPAMHFVAGPAGAPIDLPYVTLLSGNGTLPCGQDVATAVGVQVLHPTVRSPLWWYLLLEAERLGSVGAVLGPAGRVIVSEVIAGVLLTDTESYPYQCPHWDPSQSSVIVDSRGQFSLVQLLAFSGMGV